MLPEQSISSEVIESNFLVPDKDPNVILDYELGGVDIRDPSEGLTVYLWKCFYKNGWITLKNPNKEIQWLKVSGVTQVGLAFDFNMTPNTCYVVDGTTYLHWFDASSQEFITTNLGNSVTSPQISLDDHRKEFSYSSDIIFSYVKSGGVYYRQQRDRYLIEYYVGEVPEGLTLVQIGMNRKNRFQFKIH